MKSLEGFVSLGQLGAKPGQILKQNLKPQDFAMPLDKKVSFNKYYNGVMSALGEREDVPLVIRAYLKALVKYCYDNIGVTYDYWWRGEQEDATCERDLTVPFAGVIAQY